uniref:DPPIV_N domain-containing protein n=1 Tax=Steinernema glaseri TaxID=37863 RepID=A0A1I7Z1K5_9BILA
MLKTNEPISSCTLVDVQLFCYWIDDDRKRVFEQKFELKEGKVYRSIGKPVPFDRADIRHLSQQVITSVWDKDTSASVFLYDPITKGWLYRISDESFLAGRQKRKNMHHIHTAFSQYACVFESVKPMPVGLLTDIRHEAPSLGSALPEVQALEEERKRPGYEPIIGLVVVTLTSMLIYLIAASWIAYGSALYKDKHPPSQPQLSREQAPRKYNECLLLFLFERYLSTAATVLL